jgi:hypothetical protein
MPLPADLTVRRRHAWTIVFRAEVTDEEAQGFVDSGRANFGQNWLDHVTIIGPICFYCEQDFVGASWACPGDPNE